MPKPSQANTSTDGAEWQKGLEKEIGRLEAAKTWRVVRAPENAKVIPHSIVVKMEWDTRNVVTVRIVARGHQQIVGVDFDHDKTFYAAVKNLTQ